MKSLISKTLLGSALLLGAVQSASADDYALVNKEKNSAETTVEAILKEAGKGQAAQENIGKVTKVSGEAKIIRANGVEEPLTLGTKIYQGDIVETEYDAGVDIGFVDDTKFNVGEDARMTMDEFIYNPNPITEENNTSFLRSIFLYTSSLIGSQTPAKSADELHAGSLGIRG